MKCKMLLLDVDGVLTDGSIYIDKNGDEIQRFNVKDGLGIKKAQNFGIVVGVITGRGCKALDYRLNSLGVELVYQNVKDKLKIYNSIIEKYNLKHNQVCYMGDDLPDIPVLDVVGLPCCPADAVAEVQSMCKFITKNKGGNGAVRELIDYILSH